MRNWYYVVSCFKFSITCSPFSHLEQRSLMLMPMVRAKSKLALIFFLDKILVASLLVLLGSFLTIMGAIQANVYYTLRYYSCVEGSMFST
ncbi:hypothetical protein GIB67_000355 [Kingdonia uniflora]|uniref:Uncharacterized protein n=1 Tax=Kingdonia uniflora TaxID=39325 RepID=A0A7J7LCE7_9MAGN|nr:hypothetical protein GIB67_000355 [Kingdonia uniflora]